MSNLADNIESYIKRLLEASPNAAIVLQRKDLADRFKCVPSQINYVLSTRFTPERGYLVESKRGGGGYLRIRRLALDRWKVLRLLEMLRGLVREGISAGEAAGVVDRLYEAKLVTRRESLIMKAALCRESSYPGEEMMQAWRAVTLTRMLEILLNDS